MQLVEQRVHVKRDRHFRRVHVRVQTIGRNHGQLHGLAQARLLLENSDAVAQFLLFIAIYRVLAATVFNLTKVHDVVSPLDDQVNLRGRNAVLAAPRIIFRAYAGDAKSMFYLFNMRHAKPLIGQAIPIILFWCVQRVRPIMTVCGMRAAEVIVESDIKVGQLIDTIVGVDFPLTDIIFPKKVAVLKVRQHLRQISSALLAKFTAYLLACQPASVVGQQADNVFVWLRIAKEGAEQPLILTRQLGILEKNSRSTFAGSPILLSSKLR